MDYENDFVDGKAVTPLGGLHYRHHNGEGKTIVFLHGLGASTLSWKKLVALMPYGLDVYLVDLLGHGASEAPQINYTVKNQAWALKGFIEDQLLDDVYLFGHSYGGWVAAYYASKYKVKGLVLEDCAGLKEAFDQVVAANRVDDFKNAFFRTAMEVDGNKDYVIKSVLDNDFGEGELDDVILGKITAPTMIIWGKKDMLLSPTMAGMFQKKIMGSEVRFVEDAGHIPHFTSPDNVLGLLTEFISVH